MKDWFKRNSAYVRQLASTYYEELTVRENMLLSANMQMPPNTKLVQVLERVEQVINEVRGTFSLFKSTVISVMLGLLLDSDSNGVKSLIA